MAGKVRRVLASGITRLQLIPYADLDLDGSVDTADMADGAITDAKIDAAASIDVAKLGPGSNGQILSQAAGVPGWADISDVPPTPATARFAGEVAWHGGETAPEGWLVCDGSSVLRATYADLFTAIGTLHGSADGTHFNVPNLVGAHARGSAADGSTVGGTGGADSATIATLNLPAHTHTFSATTGSTSGGTPSGTVGSTSGGTPTGTLSIATATAGTPAGTISSNSAGTPAGSISSTVVTLNNATNQVIDSAGLGSQTWGTAGSSVAPVNISAVAHTHTFTGSALGTHNHTFTGSALAAHGHAGSTFTGDALSGHTHTFTGDALTGHTHSVSGTSGSTGGATALDIKPKHVLLLPVIKT